MALRRQPTRIELTVDDISEYNELKKEKAEAATRQAAKTTAMTDGNDTSKYVFPKVRTMDLLEEVEDRIGVASRYR